MAQPPGKTDRNGQPKSAQGGGSRTAAAGREFVSALRGDLAAAMQRWRRALAARRNAAPRPASSGVAAASSRHLHRLGAGLAALLIVGALGLSGTMLWALHDLPLERPLGETVRPALLIEAANGEPLGRVGPLSVKPASAQDFPPHLVQAVLSIEDRRFHHHFGVDPLGIARAMQRNMAAGEIVEGGSTITQQLVKIRMLGNDRTYTRKLREAMTAMWLEARLGKDEILTRYLNSVYMGAGAHGVAAAARLYFNKNPAELTLAEAAMLAGLIRAPSHYNPLRDLDTAQARAAVVIDAMLETGAIDEKAAAEAKAKPATLAFAADVSQADSWFADWVAREATDLTGSLTGTVRIRTTLVPEMQKIAEQVVANVLTEQGGRAGASEAALVAMRPDGAVLAMVGGRDYKKSQFNRATEANRHPGSAFKLFVYLAALRKGIKPEDAVDASPLEIKGWRPENFGDKTYGKMTLADAFAQSVNTAAVRLAMQIGLEQVITAARDLGIDARLPAVPSLALGAVEVSLLDMTAAFASVHAGRTREPWGVAAFGAESDQRLRTIGANVGAEQTLGAQRQPLIDLLRLVVERGTGRAAAVDGFAAGKTGTSQNHRDAWFIGFTEDLVVGVWVGNDDGTPMERVVGGTLPASIWKRFVTETRPLVRERKPGPAVATLPPQGSQQISTPLVPPLPQAAAPPTQPTPPTTAPTQAAQQQPTPAPQTAPARQAAQPIEAGAGQCDYRACAAAYRSFRPSDCTYQPFDGPRRVCGGGIARASEPREQITRVTIREGSRERSEEASEDDEEQPKERISRKGEIMCNVAACARFYSSFDESDCTYQPFGGGPRQICDR
jgi:1A family penicillin-binding protein